MITSKKRLANANTLNNAGELVKELAGLCKVASILSGRDGSPHEAYVACNDGFLHGGSIWLEEEALTDGSVVYNIVIRPPWSAAVSGPAGPVSSASSPVRPGRPGQAAASGLRSGLKGQHS